MAGGMAAEDGTNTAHSAARGAARAAVDAQRQAEAVALKLLG